MAGIRHLILFLTFWPRHVANAILVPQPGMEPMPSAVQAQILNHWTIKEVYLLML